MSLTRASATTLLAGRFAELLTESGVAATDTPGGLGGPIDDALRDQGVAESALTTDPVVSDANTRGFLALAEYYVLRRIWRAVGRFVDIRLDAPDVDKKRSQLAKAVKEQLDEARAAAAGYGLGTVNSWQAPAALSTDYLEPADEEVA